GEGRATAESRADARPLRRDRTGSPARPCARSIAEDRRRRNARPPPARRSSARDRSRGAAKGAPRRRAGPGPPVRRKARNTARSTRLRRGGRTCRGEPRAFPAVPPAAVLLAHLRPAVAMGLKSLVARLAPKSR